MEINYNMTADYCKDWSAIDAIREIVQNAMDIGDFKCDTSITVHTDAILPMKSFALGYSYKKAGAIGKYGEGLKLAMLRLTALGLKPVIHAGELIIHGEFKPCSVTGLDTFHLVFDKATAYPGTLFTCLPVDVEELCFKLTPFSNHPLATNKIEVLPEPGNIFVSGLWVCYDERLSRGYNFTPDSIDLNRDRNMVSGVESQLAQYYCNQTSKAEDIFNMLEHDAYDISYLQYWIHSNPDLKAELARLFYNKYGEGSKIGRPGSSYTSGYISTSNSAYGVYSSCGINAAEKTVDPGSPYGMLQSFADEHKSKLRRDIRVSLDKLIKASKAWKK